MRNRPIVTGLGPAKRGEVYRVSRLNERLRFLRYEGGEYFRPHFDGNYVTPDGKERSLFTIHLYLNGDGVQDLKELEEKIEEAERGDGLFERDGKGDLMNVGDKEVNVSFGESDSESESETDQKNIESDSSGNEAADTANLGGLLGGATSFSDGYDAKDAVRIFPKAGSVLIFQQRNLVHGGDDVFRGVKYTMRADVMYEQVCNE